MKLFPVLAAIVVSITIYVVLFERERVQNALAAQDVIETAEDLISDEPDPLEDLSGTANSFPVVAVKSTARTIDSAVTLRGQTQAFREVSLRAETSGQIISDPVRRGSFVEQDQIMCQLDPGTRQAALSEARARLAEAVSRVPEAKARVPEAEARVAEARARVDEAAARLEEAEINVNAATRLSEGGFASEIRVASALAAVRGAEAGVESAEAGLKSAQSNLETAASGIEAARAGVESARAAVASAEREIQRLSIVAPFGGILETDTAELGSLLQPGDLCATIMQLDPIILVGFAPETQVARVTLGAPARARLVTGETVEGQVSFLSRAADPQTRTFRVEVRVENTDLALSDGQTAQIEIEAAGAQAHLLPQSALTLDNAGALGVRTVDADNRVAFRAVTLLRDTSTGVWVSGLDAEADVIIIGQEFVDEGVQVAPRFQEFLQ